MGLCRRLGACFHEMLAEDGNASPLSAPPPTRPASASPATFRPGIAVVVVALALTFSLIFLLLLYVKHCKRGAGGEEGNGAGAAGFISSSAARRRNSGVARAVVESLPVFRFGALTGAHKEGLECAVCIARFETEEVLRLLPKCHHAFHVECVDTWLDAHSTCPLCRSRVDPEDVLLLLPDRNTAPTSETNTAVDGRRSKGGEPNPPPPPGRRVSGRHSSAGERSSETVKVVLHRDDPRSRRSADSAAPAPGCFEWGRKDGLLLGEREGIERRCGHRIIVANDGEGWKERWSDLRPSELIFLRSEMIMAAGSGRCSASRPGRASCSISAIGRGESAISSSARCVSEITGVSRHPGGRRRVEEERAMRKWLSFAASRTAARWPGSRGSGGNG